MLDYNTAFSSFLPFFANIVDFLTTILFYIIKPNFFKSKLVKPAYVCYYISEVTAMLKFFRRTRIAKTIIGIISAVSGIFMAVEFIAAKPFNLFSNPSGYPAFWVLLAVFLFFGVLWLVLRCIVLDAEEDIKAAFDYAAKKEKAE